MDILKLASFIEYKLEEYAIEKEAADKKKKLDPKAKVRNRGDCVFKSTHPKVKDHKDHLKVNTKGEARNALARSNQYSSSPPWFKGSLQELINAVRRKVHSKYPGIEMSEKSKKPGKG